MEIVTVFLNDFLPFFVVWKMYGKSKEVYGNSVDMYGHAWKCMEKSKYVKIYGNVWKCAKTHEELYGNVLKCTKMFGNEWKSFQSFWPIFFVFCCMENVRKI